MSFGFSLPPVETCISYDKSVNSRVITGVNLEFNDGQLVSSERDESGVECTNVTLSFRDAKDLYVKLGESIKFTEDLVSKGHATVDV